MRRNIRRKEGKGNQVNQVFERGVHLSYCHIYFCCVFLRMAFHKQNFVRLRIFRASRDRRSFCLVSASYVLALSSLSIYHLRFLQHCINCTHVHQFFLLNVFRHASSYTCCLRLVKGCNVQNFQVLFAASTCPVAQSSFVPP